MCFICNTICFILTQFFFFALLLLLQLLKKMLPPPSLWQSFVAAIEGHQLVIGLLIFLVGVILFANNCCCPLSTKEKSNLTYHVPTSLCCDQCSMLFSDRGSLIRHSESAHYRERSSLDPWNAQNLRSLSDRPQKCQHCGQQFPSSDALKQHITQTHSYKCDCCSSAFNTSQYLDLT